MAPEPELKSDHTRAFVPIEAWCYNSLAVSLAGQKVDVGLLCEALLYYDQVIVSLGNPEQFVALLKWFSDRGHLDALISMFRDETVIVYDYAFLTAPILKDDTYLLYHIQDEIQARPNSFPDRYLTHDRLKSVIPGVRKQRRLRDALAERVIEVKSEEFGSTIEAAREDHHSPERNAVLVQAFVDELYRLEGLGTPPVVKAVVSPRKDGHTITWNVNFEELDRRRGKPIGFHPGSPWTAGAMSTRMLQSAAHLRSDLYLSAPMATVVGDKLYESSRRIVKPKEMIEQLEGAVEFPRVRDLVNQGKLDFAAVLQLRRRAKKFREWLQSEAERDRDAIIAYHNEVAKQSGFERATRRSIEMFGVIGAPAMSVKLAPVVGAELAATGGAGAAYLARIAAHLGEGWRPVVFGQWMSERIRELVEEQ